MPRSLVSLRRLVRRQLPAITVLVLGLGLTWLTAAQLGRTIRAKDQERFINAVDRMQEAIERRLVAYADTLQAGAGLIDAEGRFDPRRFKAFVDRLALPIRYPGVRGVGFAVRVAPDDIPALEAEQHKATPTFAVRPPGARDDYFPIIALEPMDQRNVVAIGYDMFTDPMRRAAMEQARDGGRAAASGPVELVQEIDSNKQPGFLIYVPVYRGGGIPGSVDERRRLLLGFVYSPFRTFDLFQGIHLETTDVGFELVDGEQPDRVLYRSSESDDPAFYLRRSLSVSGREWVASFFSLPELTLRSNAQLVTIAAWVGSLMSVIFAVLVGSQTAARRRIERAERAARDHATAMERARAEAEGLNRLKDEFLATVSHELRTPMHALRGWLQILQQPGLAETRKAQALERVVSNAEIQSRLIEDLLDMSRIVAGQLRIETSEVHLSAIIQSAVDVVQFAADAKGVTIETACDDLPPILGDGNRLQQVMWNLLANAVKFTPPGGKVNIALRSQGGHATIEVTDDGSGIAPAFVPYVFDPFRQGPGSRRDESAGLGLGLSIVKNLVELHGGTISVRSEGSGRGATFLVRLPMQMAAADAI